MIDTKIPPPPRFPRTPSDTNLTVIGPVCIATGLVMIVIGVSVFVLGRKVWIILLLLLIILYYYNNILINIIILVIT